MLSGMKKLRTARVGDNQLICDCRLSWLAEWLRANPTLALYTRCSSPKAVKNRQIAELRPSQLECPPRGPPQSRFCPQQSDDCPPACKCSKRVVQCRSKSLNKVPERMPADTHEIILERNQITKVKDRSFISLRNVRRLDLSNNKIEKIEEEAFEGLSLLTSLVLYANKLTELPPNVFKGLRSLQLL